MPYDEDGNFIYPMPRRRGKAANPPAAQSTPTPLPVSKTEGAKPVEPPAPKENKTPAAPPPAPPPIIIPLPASVPTFTVHEGNNRWQMSELDLAQIWNAQIWPAPLKLMTTTGQPVEISYRGRWSGGYGPDFKGAMVKIGDIVLKGAIELHLRSGDWRLHGHHQDERYNEVVLQVVLEDNTTPTDRSVTLAGKTLPVLALLPLYKSCNERLATTLAIARASGTRLGSLSESEGPCCDRVAEHETDLMVVMKHVDELGDRRFAERVERFESECAADADSNVTNAAQALWAGLLEALGYSQNKVPFRQLAAVRPLAAIIQLESEARRRHESEEERLLNLEALLLGGAGLLPSQRQLRKAASRVAEPPVKFRTEPNWEIREQEDFLANRYIEDLERRWAWLERQPGANLAAGQPMKITDWSFARLRPPNHPARRITGLARLIVRWQLETEADLIDLLALPLAQPPAQAIKILQEKLRVPLDETESDSSAFWTRRYDFGDRAIMADGKSQTGAIDLIGSDRAADMIVNIVLPFLAAYAHDRREPDLARQARETYQQHPKLGSNELIENMARQVFKHWLENPADAQPYLDTLGDKKRPTTLTIARLVDGARRQQGLIYLHHNFCAEQNFVSCPLGG